LLVNGQKMSKSLQNFYRLKDITDKEFSPIALRLFYLQGHYRTQINFTWENLESAKRRLANYQALADLRFQLVDSSTYQLKKLDYSQYSNDIIKALQDDLATPKALALIDLVIDARSDPILNSEVADFIKFIELIDNLLGLRLLDSIDIDDSQKSLIAKRETARQSQDWARADQLRQQLQDQKIEINDTAHGPVWRRLS
jgi:cysteinyl-tRNA synthetase